MSRITHETVDVSRHGDLQEPERAPTLKEQLAKGAKEYKYGDLTLLGASLSMVLPGFIYAVPMLLGRFPGIFRRTSFFKMSPQMLQEVQTGVPRVPGKRVRDVAAGVGIAIGLGLEADMAMGKGHVSSWVLDNVEDQWRTRSICLGSSMGMLIGAARVHGGYRRKLTSGPAVVGVTFGGSVGLASYVGYRFMVKPVVLWALEMKESRKSES